MLLQQYDEKLRRWVCFGVGRVVSRDGQSPLVQTITKTNKRLGFCITTGSTINKKQDRIYQSVNCAVYSNEYSKRLFNIALSLKKNDIVQFGGWIHEGEYEDRETGEMKQSKECRIEWVMPLKVVAKYVKNYEDDDVPTVDRSTDDIPPDPNGGGIMFK